MLDDAVAALSERTGRRYHVHIEFEADGYVLRCQRDDGYHCTLQSKKPKKLDSSLDAAYGRTDTVTAENSARIWLTLSIKADVEAIIRGHNAEQAGIDPQDWWKNDPGELVATIANGTVQVREWDTQDGLTSVNQWAFFVNDGVRNGAWARSGGAAHPPEGVGGRFVLADRGRHPEGPVDLLARRGRVGAEGP